MRTKLLLFVTFLFLVSGVTSSSYASVVSPLANGGIEPDRAKTEAALTEFKSLSKKDRKLKIKEAKKAVKDFKSAKKTGKEPSTNTLLLVILAILLPPLAVYLHQGEINSKFWISLLLTLIFWIPGVIYALIVILGNND
jgi:uncharacterized membrane protein YqaE (UPF0057 family)